MKSKTNQNTPKTEPSAEDKALAELSYETETKQETGCDIRNKE